jgi:iron complex transport system substrate-binding protein
MADDDHLEKNWDKWDYEGLLEVDLDAIVFQFGFSHVSAAEFDSLLDLMRDDPVGSQLSVVENDRLYRGGGSCQGPVVNLFQTEAAARQFYPESFGEWDGIKTLQANSLGLFDRQRVANTVNGDI